MTDRRLVLITGASSGIGAEFAHQYAARGWDVALTARRGDRLEKLAGTLKEQYGVKALVVVQDLARAGSADAILKQLGTADRQVDALVNNAGYGLHGAFMQSKWKDQAAFMRVLYTAPVELAHKVLVGMRTRRFGRIVNVASLAGYLPGSRGHTLYTSVKSGMIKFSESLHDELQAEGYGDIHCTALCPGLTWTEFHDVNKTRATISNAPDWMWMETAPVVTAGIEACERGQSVIVPGAFNKGVAVLCKLLPDPVSRLFTGRASARAFQSGDT